MKTVRLYTTPFCPYCARAKSLLKKKGAELVEIDIFMDDGAREEMQANSGGARTVPQIFIAGQSVGGYEELAELDRGGQLDVLLADG